MEISNTDVYRCEICSSRTHAIMIPVDEREDHNDAHATAKD